MTDFYPLVSLHKHWLTADAVQHHLRQSTRASRMASVTESTSLGDIAQHFSIFYVLSVWYALLYVVVEGYTELDCRDAATDKLLAQKDLVDALRLFRNATFHFQKNPVPQKIMEFLNTPDSENWIAELNTALNSFFQRELKIAEAVDKMDLPKEWKTPLQSPS